jgi:hypothetical protein
MRWGRLLLTAALAIYGLWLVRADDPMSFFLHNVDLPIHETGHLVFAPFSEQVTALGGTLFQLMVPLAFLVSFFVRGDRHAASVMLWWVGENCQGIGHYMADAVAQELPLVGGGEHDFGFLFAEWNVLASSEQIGHDTRVIGGWIMLAATIWGVRAALTAAVAAPERDTGDPLRVRRGAAERV